jgi:GNAT superfamily N-acetyltransferase
VEPWEPVTDPAHPVVGELAERQYRWHERFRHADERAAREAARERVERLLPESRLVWLRAGVLWLRPDGDRTHVQDVRCAPADVPAVRELATGLAASPLSLEVVPDEPVHAAFAGDGTFLPAATTMRLDLAGEVPGERLADHVTLVPMTAAELAVYVDGAVATYARDRERAGEAAPVALEAARTSFATLLPDGVDSPGQHLFTARHDDEACGVLWLGSRWPDQAWIYDVELHPAFRGRGLGAAVLAGAARHARASGHGWLGLNVFAHNPHARSLYARLGYVVEEEYLRRPD